jgi:hypothetical protein
VSDNVSAPANQADSILAEHANRTDERLETIAKDIETTHTNAVLHIAAQLAEARDIFRYRRDEGGFGGWVETRLRYSRSTAYNLLSVHERFGGEKNLSKWLDTFPAGILYALAAPSTAETARTEIIERAQSGEVIQFSEVKNTIGTAKSREQPVKRDLDGRGAIGLRPDPAAVAEVQWDIAARLNDIHGSAGEVRRKLARLEELESEARWLRSENIALRSEIKELKAKLAQRAPIDGGLDIPGFLNRTREIAPSN